MIHRSPLARGGFACILDRMAEPKHINFDEEKHILLLDLSDDSISIPHFITLRAEENEMIRKSGFHITIFGFGVAQKLTEAISRNRGVLMELQDLVARTDWSFEAKPEFYHIKKSYNIKDVPEERETIIMMVELSVLKAFFGEANKITGLNLDIPPAHITLYSKSNIVENMDAGIGIASQDDFHKFVLGHISPPSDSSRKYHSIALPTRPQPDTIIAIFILKHFGENFFPGVKEARYVSLPRLPEGETEESMARQGLILIDIGEGSLDHHKKAIQTTASNLVADRIGVRNNPALGRLLQFAERDDFYGKGIISTDPLDRAFGLSGLIGVLNKKYVKKPEMVIELALPFIEAFYEEEEKRVFEMPKELEEKLANNRAQSFEVRQRNKKLKCILIETDNTSMAGFLRSRNGGGFDIVALKLSSGHINILTRQIQKVDLRSLAVILRLHEAKARGNSLEDNPQLLSAPGIYAKVPNWYYDTATNSLLNGGPNPQGIEHTSIDSLEFKNILELGLSEQLWHP